MTEKRKTPTKKTKDGLLAGSGAISGVFALVGASCCVLPLLLVNIGVSSALVGKLAFFARAQPYFMALTGILISTAFIAAFWKGRRPSKRVLAMLIIAALLVVGAYIMPFYEGQLLRWINAQ